MTSRVALTLALALIAAPSAVEANTNFTCIPVPTEHGSGCPEVQCTNEFFDGDAEHTVRDPPPPRLFAFPDRPNPTPSPRILTPIPPLPPHASPPLPPPFLLPPRPASDQCYNGGICRTGAVDETPGEVCICPDGYTGGDCYERVVECPGGNWHCANGGTCLTVAQGFCDCPLGWSGHRCDTQDTIEECVGVHTGKVCLHGGTCDYTSTSSDVHCDCPAVTAGPSCEKIPVTRCSGPGVYCENAGRCSADGTSCECEPGFEGSTCGVIVRRGRAGRGGGGVFADGDSRLAVAVALPLCFVIVIGCVFVAYLVRRERRGDPLFAAKEPVQIEVSDFNAQQRDQQTGAATERGGDRGAYSV